jgi:hypothetical protein
MNAKGAMTMAKRDMRPVRQGDVILVPVQDVVGDLEPAPVDPRGAVLAEGETSGHHHAVVGKSVRLMRFKDGRAARLLEIGGEGAEVRVIGGGSGGVDRHTPIGLGPGQFIVRVQRAWDSTRARQVQD